MFYGFDAEKLSVGFLLTQLLLPGETVLWRNSTLPEDAP